MADKTKWDIDNENFNHFFHKLSSLMTEHQREVLPKDLYFKLFKRGGAYDTTSTNKLSFLAKCFILIKALRRRVIIMIEDDKEGMDEEEYFKYKGLLSKRQYTVSGAADLIEDAVFVLGNKELFETHSRLNELSCSKPYNYLIKAKNANANKTTQHLSEHDYVVKFLVNYESQRKLIHMNSGLNMSEWMVLIALYDGKEVSGSKLYNEIYRYTFNSGKTKIKRSYSSLEARGFLEKTGRLRWMKLRITPLGRNFITEIMSKRLINI